MEAARPLTHEQAAALRQQSLPGNGTQLEWLLAHVQKMIDHAMQSGSLGGTSSTQKVPSPDIDVVDGVVSQSQGFSIFGTNFGSAPGEVYALLSRGDSPVQATTNLQILYWSANRIDAILPAKNVGHRGQKSSVIVIRKDDDDVSAPFDVPFEPARVTFSAHIVGSITGGAFGVRVDHVLFANMTVPAPDMQISLVEVASTGGNIRAQNPAASGDKLGQGVHAGMNVWGVAQVAVTYQVTMPVGLTPPTITDKNPPHPFWGTPVLGWIEGAEGWLFVT